MYRHVDESLDREWEDMTYEIGDRAKVAHRARLGAAECLDCSLRIEANGGHSRRYAPSDVRARALAAALGDLTYTIRFKDGSVREFQYLIRADLRGADLSGADLKGVCLFGADLRHADLRGADLREADLYGADLRGADLYGADLRGADLCMADLHRADLAGARR